MIGDAGTLESFVLPRWTSFSHLLCHTNKELLSEVVCCSCLLHM